MDSESIGFLAPKKTLSSFCDITEQKAKLSEFLLLWFYASSLGLWSHLSRHSRLEFGAECHGSTWMVHGNHFGHSPSWTTQGGKSRRPTAIHVVTISCACSVFVYTVMSLCGIKVFSKEHWKSTWRLKNQQNIWKHIFVHSGFLSCKDFWNKPISLSQGASLASWVRMPSQWDPCFVSMEVPLNFEVNKMMYPKAPTPTCVKKIIQNLLKFTRHWLLLLFFFCVSSRCGHESLIPNFFHSPLGLKLPHGFPQRQAQSCGLVPCICCSGTSLMHHCVATGRGWWRRAGGFKSP